jgi:hypothetical protein
VRLAAKRITGTAVVLILVATTVVTYAGWNAYSRPSSDQMTLVPQPTQTVARAWTQSSNTGAKGDRLDGPAQSAPMVLASLDTRSIPAAQLAPSVQIKAPVVAAAAPPPRPKAVPPSGLLDEGQIVGLKGRLRLTASQVEYWPAVEVALRNVIRRQAREMRKRGHRTAGSAPPIDVNSAEVQQLIAAALPLLMQLREDQKHEVRQMARVIGLEQVARQI